jgi:hypothetical protein
MANESVSPRVLAVRAAADCPQASSLGEYQIGEV